MENLPVIYGEMGGKGGGGHTPVEAADTLSSKQTMRLLFALSEGQIDSVEDILVNSASISNYSSTVDYEVRQGTVDQTVIKGFSEVEAPLTGGGVFPVELKAGIQHIYSLLGMYDAARINLTIPRLMQVTDLGDRVGYTVTLSVYKRHQPFGGSPGSWQLASTITKNGKCTNPYSWDVRLEKPDTTGELDSWGIMIVRDSADDSNDKHYSTTALSAITTIVESSLTYPHTALVGVTLKDAAQFGGSIPEIKFKVKGIKLPLPVNYNPTTRAYTGVWNGAFKSVREYTDNLAWITYWVLREHGSTFLDSEWGLEIAASDIDVGSFYLYAQYCDQLVSDGKGGQEPRYTAHFQFIERDNVPTFLTYLLNLGNANFSSNSLGQISIIWDGAGQSITKVVSNATVVDGVFEYSSNDLEGRTNLVNVTYAREELFGDSDTATHYEQTLIDRYGLQTSDVVLFGCKSEAQALRKARAVLYNNCYATDLVTFRQLFQGATYQIGELVSVMDSDNVVTDPKHGIIIESSLLAGTTTLALDRSIVLTNASYTVQFIGADGTTFLSKAITQTNGSFSSVTYTGSEVPFVGGTVLFSTTALTPRTVKVIKVDKDDEHVYTVTGLTHNESKYSYIETVGSIATPSGSFINFNNFTVPAVSNITVDEVFSSNGVVEFSKLAVDWDWNVSGTEDYRATFDISYRRDNQEYQQARNLGTSDFDIEYPLPGVYDIYIWAVNPFSGLRSVVTTVAYNFRVAFATSTLLPPTNVVVPNTAGVVFQQRDLPLTWTFPVANDTKVDKLKDYVVQVLDYATSTVKGTYTVSPNTAKGGDFLLTFAENAAIFGTSQRQFRVRVFSRDLVGDLSNYVEVVPNNPAPVLDVTPTVSAVFGAAYIKATIPSDPDLVSYTFKKYSAATGGTLLGTITTVSNYVDFEATAGTEYFYTVTPNDSFGTGTESTRTASTALSVDPDTYTYTGLQFTPNSPANNYITWSSFVAIKNGSTNVTVNAGNAQWTTGTLYLYYIPGDTTFHSTTSATTAIAAGGRILATYKGGTEITADAGKAFIDGDQIIAGSLLASALTTDVAYITNMAQIGNILESDNYSNAGIFSGWRLDKSGTLYANGIIIKDLSGDTVLASGSGLWEGTTNWSGVGGVGKPADNATVGANSSNLAIGTSTNVIKNSDFYNASLSGWSITGIHLLTGITIGVDLGGWYPVGGHAGWIHQDNANNPTGYVDFGTENIPVIAGTRYEYQGKTGAHRCQVDVFVYWFNSAGSVVGNTALVSNNAEASGGTTLAGYKCHYGFGVAPANAVFARFVIRKNGTFAGQGDSWAFFTQAYFGTALANQTEASSWSAGGSAGAFANLNLITSNNTTTYIDSANGKVLNNLQQWAEVNGATKPEDNATKSRVFQQATAPTSGMTLNDLWVDTTTLNPAVYRWSGASWMLAGDITANNTAAGIAGQGALATANSANWSAQVTGTGKPADYADVTNYSDNRVANSLLLANSGFNLITDDSLSSPIWWGFGSNTLPTYVSAVSATSADQPTRFYTITAGIGQFDWSSTRFSVANSTQYRIKLSMFISSDFVGFVGPVVHVPGVVWALPGNTVTDPNGVFPNGHTATSWSSGSWQTREIIVTTSAQADLNWLQTRIYGRVSTGYFAFSMEVTPLSAWGDIQDPTGTKPANNADVTNYNDTRVSNVIEENNTLSVSRPVGASFNNNQLAVTGMIRIILPQGFTNTMMKFTVNVYTYSQDKSFSLNLAGYNHYNSGAWYSTEANLLGSTAADNRVRFGYDSTLGKCCIYIGEPTSSWSIPKVMVKDFIAGYSNFARSQWETGWAIDIVTSAPQNVSQDYADALIDAASIRNQGTLATANSANWSSQVTGTGKPADYADVTAYNTAAGIAGQGALATKSSVSYGSDITNLPGLGANRLVNTDFKGITGWFHGWNPGGANIVHFNDSTTIWGVDAYWRPKGSNALAIEQVGIGSNDIAIDIYNGGPWSTNDQRIAVKPNTKYEFSARIAAHGCIGIEMYVAVYNSNGDNISTWFLPYGSWYVPGIGGPDINSYTQYSVFFISDPTAAYVQPGFRKGNTQAGQTNSWMWITQPYFGEAAPSQTTASAYVPGAPAGAFANLNQINSTNASTYIANAAIGSAQIANAAISNAQIDRASVNKLQVVTADIVDANVSTLKIAGNAVTIPVFSKLSSLTAKSAGSWQTVLSVVVPASATDVRNFQIMISCSCYTEAEGYEYDYDPSLWDVNWRIIDDLGNVITDLLTGTVVYPLWTYTPPWGSNPPTIPGPNTLGAEVYYKSYSIGSQRTFSLQINGQYGSSGYQNMVTDASLAVVDYKR